MKFRKLTALLVTACMGAALLAGCGGGQTPAAQEGTKTESEAPTEAAADGEASGASEETAPEVDTSEHVVLTMYCIGDEGGIYAEDHMKKLNEVLTEKINASIEPIMVSWGDYSTKLPMVWASGEAYDLTYTSNWTDYYLEAEKGAFMDITDLFPQYAPKTYAECVERGALDSTKVDGRLYMIPKDSEEYTAFMYNYREDLRKKYNCPEIVDMETFETYLQAIKDNEPGMMAIGNSSTYELLTQNFLTEQDWSRPVELNNGGIFSYSHEDPTKVFNLIETPEYEAFVKKCREYYEKGFWSQSVMAETTAPKENFIAGKAAVYLGNDANSNGTYREITAQHPDWEIGVFCSELALGTKAERIAPSNNGVAVGAYSKNPERALMFVELCYQDEEVHDILMNGLEGITYEADKTNMTKWIPEGVNASDTALKNLGMGFGTVKFELGSLNDSPLVEGTVEEMDKVAFIPELAGFSVDQSSISAELAALKSISDEYKVPLEKGVVDPEEGLAELRRRMKDAGADKVMEEINRQITEYLAQ